MPYRNCEAEELDNKRVEPGPFLFAFYQTGILTPRNAPSGKHPSPLGKRYYHSPSALKVYHDTSSLAGPFVTVSSPSKQFFAFGYFGIYHTLSLVAHLAAGSPDFLAFECFIHVPS